MDPLFPELAYYCERLNFPADAAEMMIRLLRIIEEAPFLAPYFQRLGKELFSEKKLDYKHLDAYMAYLSDSLSQPVESMSLLFLLSGLPALRSEYRQRGISEAVFWNSIEDLRSKALECKEMRGIWGTFVSSWFEGLFLFQRFGMGRFQYSIKTMEANYTLPSGLIIPEGAPKLACHIPSNGLSLTDEVRFASYRKAYEFFQAQRIDGLLVISCGSWLMDPENKKYLPADSNIPRFLSDFDLISVSEEEGFRDGWRIFGHSWGVPYVQLPEDTALQRAYKQRLPSAGKTARGLGMLVFDGERIVNLK